MLSSQMQACSVIVIIVFDLITIRAEVSCHGRSRYVRFFLIDTVLDVIHRSKMGGTSASSWCRRSCVREQTRTGREITSTRLPEEPPPHHHHQYTIQVFSPDSCITISKHLLSFMKTIPCVHSYKSIFTLG